MPTASSTTRATTRAEQMPESSPTLVSVWNDCPTASSTTRATTRATPSRPDAREFAHTCKRLEDCRPHQNNRPSHDQSHDPSGADAREFATLVSVWNDARAHRARPEPPRAEQMPREFATLVSVWNDARAHQSRPPRKSRKTDRQKLQMLKQNIYL